MDIVTLRLLLRRDGDAKLMSFYYSSYSWAEKVRDFGGTAELDSLPLFYRYKCILHHAIMKAVRKRIYASCGFVYALMDYISPISHQTST